MIARIVAAMTATMLEEKRKKEEKKKKRKEALIKKNQGVHKNTSRGVGRYMGEKHLEVLKMDE